MIVVVGEALVDIVVGADGSSTEAVGGSPLNVAVGLGRLEVPTLLVTEAGDDERGRRLVAHVAGSGAEIETAPAPLGRTATATAVLDATGAASYVFDLAWALPAQTLPACDALHVGSLGTFLEPGCDTVLDLVDQAYARDVFVSYDPNLRSAFVTDPERTWRDVEALAGRSTLVKLSDEDALLLHPDADPGDIARSLLAGERTELVVLTRGAHGATAYVEGAHVTVPPLADRVVDTVGAGDSFMSALLAILFEDGALSSNGAPMPADEAGLTRLLRGAGVVSAITVGRRGADPPRRSDLPESWPNQV